VGLRVAAHVVRVPAVGARWRPVRRLVAADLLPRPHFVTQLVVDDAPFVVQPSVERKVPHRPQAAALTFQGTGRCGQLASGSDPELEDVQRWDS
jgi:hypothetical protein